MRTLSFVEFPRLLVRRKLWILPPLILGLGIGFLAYRLLPPVYRASAVIMVESQKVPASYVKTTVTTSLKERLQTIEQQIVSRRNLEGIIHEMNLYPDLVAAGQMGQAVATARKALVLEVRGEKILKVFFRGQNPQQVAATANRIVDLLIHETLRSREEQALNTSAFLEAELDSTKARLEELETRFTDFRLRNDGRLPEQRDSNLAALAHLGTKLDINLDDIENSEMRKLLLARSGPLEGGSGSALLDRVRSLRLELADLQARFTDRHPDVVRLRSQIEVLESEMARQPTADPSADLSAADSTWRTELAAVEVELGRLSSERQQILADIQKYQQRLEQTSRVEQLLISLTRDYESVKRSYQSLLAKRLDARLAENLEKRGQTEQFTVLETAFPPSRPYSPDLALLLLVGGALGGLLGLGLAFYREETDQTYSSAEELHKAFPALPILAAIPNISIRDGRKAAPRETRPKTA